MDGHRPIGINVVGSDIPPNDWLLQSFSPHQLEASIVKTYFWRPTPLGSNYPEAQFLAPPQNNADFEYLRQFSAPFWNDYQNSMDRYFFFLFVSPITHNPVAMSYENFSLSHKIIIGDTYYEESFRNNLRLSILGYLCSPETAVRRRTRIPGTTRYPAERYPVRLFTAKLTDCGYSAEPGLCIFNHANYLYERLPRLNYHYTASIYVASKPRIDIIDLKCIGYLKRVVMRNASVHSRHANSRN